MLRGIRQWWTDQSERNRLRVQETKERREREHQEAEQKRQLALAAQAEEERQKREMKRKVMAILAEGKVPEMSVSVFVPFKLLKNEKWLLAAEGVPYSEMRVKREIVGRSAGASVRVAKGVTLRTSGSRGTPVESDVLTPRGMGVFAVSTRHIFFNGERSFRIPLNKIVSVQATPPRGLEVVRDRANAMPEYFGIAGEDAEFVAELIHILPTVEFGRGEPQMQDVASYVLFDGDTWADDMFDEN